MLFNSAFHHGTRPILNASAYSNAYAACAISSNSWGGAALFTEPGRSINEGAPGGLFIARGRQRRLQYRRFPNYPLGYALDNIIAVAPPTATMLWPFLYQLRRTTVDIGARPARNLQMISRAAATNWPLGNLNGTPHVSVGRLLIWDYKALPRAADVQQ